MIIPLPGKNRECNPFRPQHTETRIIDSEVLLQKTFNTDSH